MRGAQIDVAYCHLAGDRTTQNALSNSGAERRADVFVSYDQNLTGLRGLSMSRTTFPLVRSNLGFQTVCKWRMDVSAVAGGQAVKLHQCDQSQ